MAVAVLTLGSLIGWILFDVLAMKLKYEEWRDPAAGCMPMAHSAYSPSNRDMLVGIKYYFNIVWTTHSSSLFLLLVFLQNLAKPHKLSLGSSREFLAYKVWAPCSLLAYPALQTLFDFVLTSVRSHTLLASVAPQLANHAETAFVAVMLFRANRKLHRLAWSCDSSASSSVAALRMRVTMINLLVVFLLLDVVGLATINVDVMLMTFEIGGGIVFRSAFLSDLSITIFSIGLTGAYLTVLAILFPPTHLFEQPTATFGSVGWRSTRRSTRRPITCIARASSRSSRWRSSSPSRSSSGAVSPQKSPRDSNTSVAKGPGGTPLPPGYCLRISEELSGTTTLAKPSRPSGTTSGSASRLAGFGSLSENVVIDVSSHDHPVTPESSFSLSLSHGVQRNHSRSPSSVCDDVTIADGDSSEVQSISSV